MAGEGFTFVEILATCPTNWGMGTAEANQICAALHGS